jgi:hypothetical protein
MFDQKDPIKMVMLNLNCPKWHFGQIGRQKGHENGFFD